MSSPERMERLAEAVGHLVDAMRLMGAEQDLRDRRMAEFEEQMSTYEAQLQASNARLRELDAESRENRARINEIIGVLTQIQADIARLDAAS